MDEFFYFLMVFVYIKKKPLFLVRIEPQNHHFSSASIINQSPFPTAAFPIFPCLIIEVKPAPEIIEGSRFASNKFEKHGRSGRFTRSSGNGNCFCFLAIIAKS